MSPTPWLVSAAVLLVALVPCGLVALRGDATNRLVGLEMGSIVTTMLLVVLAQAFRRPAFHDLPLTLALLAFGGTIVFTRFFERWL